MASEDLKKRCMDNISSERQLEAAEEEAGNFAMMVYHRGRKEVWVNVHEELVRTTDD